MSYEIFCVSFEVFMAPPVGANDVRAHSTANNLIVVNSVFYISSPYHFAFSRGDMLQRFHLILNLFLPDGFSLRLVFAIFFRDELAVNWASARKKWHWNVFPLVTRAISKQLRKPQQSADGNECRSVLIEATWSWKSRLFRWICSLFEDVISTKPRSCNEKLFDVIQRVNRAGKTRVSGLRLCHCSRRFSHRSRKFPSAKYFT